MRLRSDEERHLAARLLQEMICEAQGRIDQLRRTADGIQQRMDVESQLLEALQSKHAEIVEGNRADESDVTVAEWIASVFRECRRPMQVSEIADMLKEIGGVEVPEGSIMSALSRRGDLFERVARGQYQLSEKYSASSPDRIQRLRRGYAK